MIILGIDTSSVRLGWVVLADGSVQDRGIVDLDPRGRNRTPHADRCRLARAAVLLMLECHPDVDLVAVEAPASRFTGSLIVQCQVRGAVLCAAAERQMLTLDVAPTEAKQALAGSGGATKPDMLGRCRSYFGIDGVPDCVRGVWVIRRVAMQSDILAYEDEADALGVALFASRKAVEVPA